MTLHQGLTATVVYSGLAKASEAQAVEFSAVICAESLITMGVNNTSTVAGSAAGCVTAATTADGCKLFITYVTPLI